MPIIATSFDTKLRRFWLSLNFSLFDCDYIISGVVDTGCTTSLISGKDLFPTDVRAMHAKLDALEEHRRFRVGGGVHKDRNVREHLDYSIPIMNLQSRDDLIFNYTVPVRINNLVLDNQRLFVGFDYKCSTLIGMDILEKFNIYVGYDINGTYKLVACLKGDKESELEFYNYLEDNFDLVQKPRLLARLFRKDY